MKFRAERNEFADAVAWATRTVGARVTMPALSGVLLHAEEGRLTCRATDLEIAAEISIPVQIEQSGTVLLPGKLLSQIVAKLPDAPVEIDGTSDKVSITCGRSNWAVRTMTAADFPQLPVVDDAAPRGAIKVEAFTRLVNQVARAASSEESRPVLTGVMLEAKEGSLSASATDSYRLAIRTLPWDQTLEGAALVPSRALQEASKAAAESGGAVTLVVEEGQVSFVFGDRRLTTRLIEGQFPNVRGLLPETHETTVIVERAALMDALQRVAVVGLGQQNAPVTLTFGDGTVELAAASSEVGEASEALPAEVDGDAITIAFNPTFLAAGLDVTGTEKIRIELRDGLKPAVLKPHVDPAGDAEAEDFTYLLMPMRVS